MLLLDALCFEDPQDLNDVQLALREEFDNLLLPCAVSKIDELGGVTFQSPLEPVVILDGGFAKNSTMNLQGLIKY